MQVYDKNRPHGYYWVRLKKTKGWCIAYWHPDLNKGKGFWDGVNTITGFHIGTDTVDLVYPVKLTSPPIEDLQAFGLLPKEEVNVHNAHEQTQKLIKEYWKKKRGKPKFVKRKRAAKFTKRKRG